MANARIVYRFGSATDDALTPREKDRVNSEGQKPGLSVEESEPGPGQKAQKIDLTLLAGTGLAYFPDDPLGGGRAGHGTIAPVNVAGELDEPALREWVSYRGSGARHRFTQAVLDAIVEKDVRSRI